MDELLLQNPWWEDKNNIEADVHIKKLKVCKYVYEPKLFRSSDLGKDAVYTLRGARQVGKTTLVKLIIKDLLEKSINPRNIFYYSMDLVKDDKELFEIFISWYQTIKENKKENTSSLMKQLLLKTGKNQLNILSTLLVWKIKLLY